VTDDAQSEQEIVDDDAIDAVEVVQEVVDVAEVQEVEADSETPVEAELSELADGLDQAAIEELLLEQAPSFRQPTQPVIEEIELEPLVPLDDDPSADTDIGLLLEVPLSISVELGRTSLTIRELLALGQGSILQLDRHAGEPVDVLVNGKRLARGEVVVIDEDFGIRVTEVVTPEERISGMGR
jgi:flagellar motor switch protein FliN